MYSCCRIKRFFKILLVDIILVAVIIIVTGFNKEKWFALDEMQDKGIFLPVIMYHIVSEDPSRYNDYVVSPETIENDMAYLVEAGYKTVTVADLLAYVNDGESLPEKPIMLTFDDGYYNNMEYILPLLEKYGMTAVFSVVGDYIEMEENEKERNVNYSYLNWEEIDYLNKTGLVEIGNHTSSLHSDNGRRGACIMNGENADEYQAMLKADVGGLQRKLKENSGVESIIFTYPYGFFCKESVPVLKELGFKATFICSERANYISRNENTLYGLNRYNRPYGINTADFMDKVLTEK